MSNEQTKHSSWEYFLLRAARKISLSAAQYSVIDARYSQLEKILSAADDPLLADAHIFPQGSMRLQTTINPVPGAPADLGTIDADAIVWLPHARGIDALSKHSKGIQAKSMLTKNDITYKATELFEGNESVALP